MTTNERSSLRATTKKQDKAFDSLFTTTLTLRLCQARFQLVTNVSTNTIQQRLQEISKYEIPSNDLETSAVLSKAN